MKTFSLEDIKKLVEQTKDYPIQHLKELADAMPSLTRQIFIRDIEEKTGKFLD